jgi:hypothetical protein
MELHEYEWALYEMVGEPLGDMWQAGGTAPNREDAEREAMHYLSMYASDDNKFAFRYEMFEVTRKSLGGLARLPDA